MQLKSKDITYCVKKIDQTINSVESLRDINEGFVKETKGMLKEKNHKKTKNHFLKE